MPKLECEWCGKKFEVKPARKETARFCSRKCKGKWTSKNIKGENHPRYKHGAKNKYPKFYNTWKRIRQRCRNENYTGYKNYGGRGISVCERWEDFENFKEDMLKSFKKHRENNETTTIERIDNDGDYCPENCKWITKSKQSKNRRMKKLSKEKVKEIRKKHKKGSRGVGKKLAKEYGVSKGVISEIVNKKRNYSDI